MRWFRFYNEIIDDPKIAKMNPKMFKFFVFLLCLASECEQNGVIPLSKKDLSWRLRIPIKKVNLYINRLKELKILTDNPVISFINWDKRQYKSDSSKERVKRFRDKKCNVTVTPTVTPPEQSRTDTERNIKEKSFNIRKKEFDTFFILYPNRQGKKGALVKWESLLKKNELPSLAKIITAIKKQITWRDNANGEFRPEWKHPSTWLHQGCWDDEVMTKQPKKIYEPE